MVVRVVVQELALEVVAEELLLQEVLDKLHLEEEALEGQELQQILQDLQ